MIIGKIGENEKSIRFELDLNCSNCKKKVPGGMKCSEKFYQSKSFDKQILDFKKNYLCGICRDKKRIKKKINS
ncbi:MAG: hypothetical protein HKM23_05900 [Nitrosopumilus sp.]|nr:hypothetical protein [Nitrosopumilus sp.]